MRIYLSPPNLLGAEQTYLKSVFDDNWVAPVGPQLNAFEKRVSDYAKISSAVALNSGTAGLHLALKLLGIQKGDVVLCPTFTFVATINPVVYVGAEPVFIDSERDTWNICPETLEDAILAEKAKGKKVKALVLIQGYGMPAKTNELLAVAQQYNLKVIEDAAAAIGSTYKGKMCGTFGDIGVYSFNGNKMITTSAGGMLLIHKKTLARKAFFLATQAKDKADEYNHSQVGYNYRMSNVLAAIGLGQMDYIETFIEIRRRNFNGYKQALKELPIDFLEEAKDCHSNYWLSNILLPNFDIREKVRVSLLSKKIESRPLWKPMHQQELYKNHVFYSNGVSDDLFARGLSLPSGTSLSLLDIEEISNIVRAQF